MTIYSYANSLNRIRLTRGHLKTVAQNATVFSWYNQKMIFRNSLLLAFFSTLSLLLGIVRDRLLADYVGIGHVLDLYNISFRIPDLLYGSLLAFISAATVVPFLTKEDTNGHQISPLHRLISLTSLYLAINVVVGFFLFASLPYIAHFIVPTFNEGELAEYVHLTRILMVQPLFLGLASLFSCYAQLRNEFFLLGVSPLLYSFGIIYGILYFYPTYGVDGLIYGVVIGAFLSLLLQAFSLRTLRKHHFKHFFSWHLTKEAIRLALPRTGTNLITQVRVIIFHGFATTLGPGFLSAYLFASRITEAVVQIFQQSFSTASIPVLSKAYAEKRMDAYKGIVKKYTSLLFIAGIFFSSCIFVLQDKVIGLLYGQSNMNHLIAYFLLGALIGLPFQMLNGYLSISFYSIHDAKSVMYAYLGASVIAVIIVKYGTGAGPFMLMLGNLTFWITSTLLLLFFYSRKKM